MKSKKLILGVGIMDIEGYTTQVEVREGKNRTVVWRCTIYQTWYDVLRRCYSESCQSRQPTYKGCSVCEEWKTFSNFKSWMEVRDYEGKQLDKDLLIKGNRVYSPDTCIFVPPKVNAFIIDCGRARGEYMIGVHLNKESNKFVARCRNPFNGKRESLGYYSNELDAHLAWKKRKHELACQLAESDFVTDTRLVESLRTRYL